MPASYISLNSKTSMNNSSTTELKGFCPQIFKQNNVDCITCKRSLVSMSVGTLSAWTLGHNIINNHK